MSVTLSIVPKNVIFSTAANAAPALAGTFADAVGTFKLMESQLNADRFRPQEFSFALASLDSFAASEKFYLPMLRAKETSRPTQRHFAFFRDVQFPIAARAIALRCDKTLSEYVNSELLPRNAENKITAFAASRIDPASLQSAVISGLVQMASAEAFCGLVPRVAAMLKDFPPNAPDKPSYLGKAMARFAVYGAATYTGFHFQLSSWYLFLGLMPLLFEAASYSDFSEDESSYFRRLNEIKTAQENAAKMALSMREIAGSLAGLANDAFPEERFVRRVKLSADRPEFRRALLNSKRKSDIVVLAAGDKIRPSAREGSYAVVKLPTGDLDVRLAVGKRASMPDPLEGEQVAASGNFKIVAKKGLTKLFFLTPEAGHADVGLFKKHLKEYRVVAPKRNGGAEQAEVN